MKLKNARHERFCQEYIVDLNGTKAARRSGFSKKTARTQASLLLTNVDIQNRIAELQIKRSERTQVTQDMIIEELKILAFSDFRDYGKIVKSLGVDRLKLKTFRQIKGDATRAIKSISEKVTKDGVKLSFKLHGKTPAIELLGKHLGMFIERHQINGNVNIKVISAVPRSKKGKKK